MDGECVVDWGVCRPARPPPLPPAGPADAMTPALTWGFPAFAGSGRRPTGGRVGRPGHGLGTSPGDAGDTGWRGDDLGAQRSFCPRVDNRRTLTTHNRPTGP